MTTPKTKDENEHRSTKTLEVAFLLDITGSMGSQIDGVKLMVSQFCSIERPGVNVHIITFTENSKNCYVTHSSTGLNSAKLVEYVNSIKLSTPPGTSGIVAPGGDGPENVVAATTMLLKQFEPSDNILAFIITDDAPHHKSFGASAEAEAEKRWLTENGFENHDIFARLNELVETLNITIVPVLYGQAHAYKWYQQAALLTDGLVLCPQIADSYVLADGLGLILDAVQRLAVTRQIDAGDLQNLNGFAVLGLNFDDFVPLESDPESLGECKRQAVLHRDANEIKASLLGLLETTFDRFSGKKSAKRCRAVDASVIAASVRVLVVSMLHAVDSPLVANDDFERNVAKLMQVLERSGAESKKSEMKLVNLLVENIGELKEKLKLVDKSDKTSVQCLITLNSALEYLNGLEQMPSTEEEVAAWMEMAMQLSMCRLLNITFPLDFYGKPDFNDAWAASIRFIELATTLSASSAAKLRNAETGIYVDPLSRRENTTAMIVAHPNDAVLSVIYKCLTCLASLLGLIQSYLVSGGLKVSFFFE